VDAAVLEQSAAMGAGLPLGTTMVLLIAVEV